MGMRTLRRTVSGAAAGAMVWTATEYGVHRWAMHGRRGANAWSEEHLDHHARPMRTFAIAFDRNTAFKLVGVPVVGLPAAAIGWAVGGRSAALPVGLSAGLGFSTSYAGYTHVHHLIHHQPPRSSLGRWTRKHHLAHHFTTPKRNFGVTHGWWDILLRTDQTPDVVKVPRRLAPAWLIDDGGIIRPEYADDYVLGGRTNRPVADVDVVAAMDDRVPALD